MLQKHEDMSCDSSIHVKSQADMHTLTLALWEVGTGGPLRLAGHHLRPNSDEDLSQGNE